MSIITLPPDVAQKLREAGGKALLCDEHGQPVGESNPPALEVIGSTPVITDEEWAEAKRSGQWVRLGELISELKGQ